MSAQEGVTQQQFSKGEYLDLLSCFVQIFASEDTWLPLLNKKQVSNQAFLNRNYDLVD